MPTIEYRCGKCHHRFEKLVFRGDDVPSVRCPECGEADAEIIRSPESLFNGIANFSALAKNTD